MANDYFTNSGYPPFNANGDSASARAEFALVTSGFDKLPSLAGFALRLVRVNAAGTALESVTAATARLMASDGTSTATANIPLGGFKITGLAAATVNGDAVRFEQLGTLKAHASTVTGNPHAVTKADIGLGNVDNTSDVNKPVSTAQQAALNLKAALDANTEVIQLPAGAATEVAAGRTNSMKRADGSWSALVRHLYNNYPLQTWAEDLSLGAYDVFLSVSQNGLPASWWYIEVMRHYSDSVNNQYRYLRATPLNNTLAILPIYHCSVVQGVWSVWAPVGDNPLTWYTPTFVNSWTDYGAGWSARYAKDLTNGIVYIKGLVRGGSNTITTTIFTLPVGMRPSTTIMLSQVTLGGVGRVDIPTSGAVRFVSTDPHTGNANGYLSISATFKAGL